MVPTKEKSVEKKNHLNPSIHQSINPSIHQSINPSIKILILLLLPSGSSRSSTTRRRHLDLLALLGLQREDNDKQRFVRGAVLEDVSERVRTVRQQERGSCH